MYTQRYGRRIPPYSPIRRRKRANPSPLLGLLVVAAVSLVVWGRFGPHSTKAAVGPTEATQPVASATSDESVAMAAPADTPTAVPTPTAVVIPTATPIPPSPTPAPPYVFTESWLADHPAHDPPQLTAKAAIVVDYDTRRVLYALHEHDRRAQASLTKIMTADVAIDSAPLDTPIRITQDAVETEPDHMGVQLNEVIPLRDLLYGMLLNSGNDAAYAIADGLGGMDAFVAKMNQRAAQLQLRDTHFANPAGFDDPNHYTSAYDLVIQTTDALQRHPEFKQIVSTKKQIIDPTKTHGWFGPVNLNNLLWDYQGAFGVKPGLTDNAGYCLVGAATRNGHTVVAVVLGVPTDRHFFEGAKLLDYGFKRVGEE